VSLERLLAVLPPPGVPLESQGDWGAVEAELGTPLPADYRRYVERYGSGRIHGFIWPCNPFTANRYLRLQNEIRHQLEGLRGTRAQFPEWWNIPLFPEEGGFLAWGKTDNGDSLQWVTRGAPEEWTVVVTPAREPEFDRHACGMTDFLARVLTREVVCRVFPSSFPGPDPVFDPMS
jgi:SUKH superfamily protein